ncbi:Glutamyl-tRNA reductase OS=Streptomyces tendae OX=1932 GN=hemA PE=3 SV=1 [Streptomyces tendae]
MDRSRETGRTGPEAEAELIGALAATATRVGRIPERRRPEPVAEVPRPEPVLFLLDLAMPRDVDAAVHPLAGVRLVDIESLADASADAPMAADADMVRRIVADRGRRLRRRPARGAHHAHRGRAAQLAADLVAGEIARLEAPLPGLADNAPRRDHPDRQACGRQAPARTDGAGQAARRRPGGAGYADALRTLFDLDQETVASVSSAGNSTTQKNRGPA